MNGGQFSHFSGHFSEISQPKPTFGARSGTPGGRGGRTRVRAHSSTSLDPIQSAMLPRSYSDSAAVPHSNLGNSDVNSVFFHSMPCESSNSVHGGRSESGAPTLESTGDHASSSNSPTRPRALDLFSGTGSVGDRLREIGYDVISLDIDPNRRPTIVTDVLKWDYAKDFSPGFFSVIAAGVPCNEYSSAKTIGHRNLDYADRLVEKTLEIIHFFQPPIWWIENPKMGLLKTREVIRGIPYIDVDYCQFGDWGYQKPTRIWCCDAISKLPSRVCDGVSCPNFIPNTRKHKYLLGGYNMKHTTLLKGRMPAKLIDYLLQIPTNIRQVQVSQGGLVISDTFSVGSLTKIGLDLQLTMLLKVRTPGGSPHLEGPN